MTNGQHPHGNMPVYTAGTPLEEARGAMIMIHGRGATAQDILMLGRELDHPDFVYLAPQAFQNSWYPYGFMNPMDSNQPYLDSALRVISGLLDHLRQEGFSASQIMLAGFSQGACLATEYVARNPDRYGGIAGLSGGLIGPEGTPRDYPGELDGTPVFLGCSDVDFHIPKERVLETADVFRRMGAEVTDRLYPGMGHTVNRDEISFVRAMMDGVVKE